MASSQQEITLEEVQCETRLSMKIAAWAWVSGGHTSRNTFYFTFFYLLMHKGPILQYMYLYFAPKVFPNTATPWNSLLLLYGEPTIGWSNLHCYQKLKWKWDGGGHQNKQSRKIAHSTRWSVKKFASHLEGNSSTKAS